MYHNFQTDEQTQKFRVHFLTKHTFAKTNFFTSLSTSLKTFIYIVEFITLHNFDYFIKIIFGAISLSHFVDLANFPNVGLLGAKRCSKFGGGGIRKFESLIGFL